MKYIIQINFLETTRRPNLVPQYKLSNTNNSMTKYDIFKLFAMTHFSWVAVWKKRKTLIIHSIYCKKKTLMDQGTQKTNIL